VARRSVALLIDQFDDDRYWRLGVLALLVSHAGFGVAEVLPSWA
jgi:hypothetical protein